MKIFVNESLHEFNNSCTLSDILVKLELTHSKGKAIAVNNKIVPKNKWTEHQLNENDKILIITATQGG